MTCDYIIYHVINHVIGLVTDLWWVCHRFSRNTLIFLGFITDFLAFLRQSSTYPRVILGAYRVILPIMAYLNLTTAQPLDAHIMWSTWYITWLIHSHITCLAICLVTWPNHSHVILLRHSSAFYYLRLPSIATTWLPPRPRRSIRHIHVIPTSYHRHTYYRTTQIHYPIGSALQPYQYNPWHITDHTYHWLVLSRTTNTSYSYWFAITGLPIHRGTGYPLLASHIS